jgi:hypothetical protein
MSKKIKVKKKKKKKIKKNITGLTALCKES